MLKQKRRPSSKQSIRAENIEKNILKKYPNFFKPHDKYEEWLIKAIENDEFVPMSKEKAARERKMLVEAAREYLRKEKRVNIRVNEGDLLKIKAKSVKAGLPYQTLINALLHQYAENRVKIEL